MDEVKRPKITDIIRKLEQEDDGLEFREVVGEMQKGIKNAFGEIGTSAVIAKTSFVNAASAPSTVDAQYAETTNQTTIKLSGNRTITNPHDSKPTNPLTLNGDPVSSTITSPCDEDYVRVYWPPELANLRHEFRRFIESMTYKLRKNANKNTPDEADLPKLFELLRGEIDELEQAVREGNSIETLLEASDAANFCMLVAAVAMKRGIK